ncbi:hypothetical protein [uncultured Fusobacterium sp.]|uniref:hypothetical protein n=1 Tax=uncultured Fusobacterium sp. TaxID=159267 RepID=UPI00280553F7|nr:hypothetical protein [uncultured Fusobacterium sp.]
MLGARQGGGKMEKVKKINEKVENIIEILKEMSYDEKMAVIIIAHKVLEVTYDPYLTSPK